MVMPTLTPNIPRVVKKMLIPSVIENFKGLPDIKPKALKVLLQYPLPVIPIIT